MSRPHTLPGDPRQRFFARIDRFVCECPKCGELILAYFDSSPRARRFRKQKDREDGRTRASVYNPLTATVCCPGCRKAFGVGLLLWPLQERKQRKTPPDIKPTWKQLLELRRSGGGFMGDHPIDGAEEVNAAIVADCLCQDGGLHMGCPIHGWEAANRKIEAGQDRAREESKEEGEE